MNVAVGLGLLTLGFAEVVFARNPEQNRLYRSAHFLLRGDTGIAEADHQEAIWYNPAGLAQGTGIYKKTILASPHVEVSNQAKRVYDRLEVDKEDQVEVLKDQIGKPMHLGVTSMTAIVLRRAAISGTSSNAANILVRKDPDAGSLETVDADLVSNQVVNFALAESFFSQSILLGGSLKYLRRIEGEISQNIIDADAIKDLDSDSVARTGAGYGFDFGLMFKPGKNSKFTEHSFGLLVSDVGDTTLAAVNNSEDPHPILQTVNVGYSLSMGTKVSRLKLLADYRDIAGRNESNTLKRIHLGGEINIAEFVGFCGGLSQGYVSAGAYVDVRFVRVDLGYYTEERGERVGMYPDQRYVLRIIAAL